MINYNFSQNDLIWMIFAMLACICGLIGAYKEHFLMTLLCALTWTILLALTYFKRIYGGYYYADHGYFVEIGLSVGGFIYAIVLHSNGHRETGFPNF
ncbi:hypothetical protein BLA29_003565 [Euroglyphus maynei]|uniref:Uncharacterized protein n=1 Tax=Euroglyphus maynei TaxID=6958 RepID=A0A1Y3B080_EURMA|nr:hypothetical protein BLA29_003565 [Euroglyphus maynei]